MLPKLALSLLTLACAATGCGGSESRAPADSQATALAGSAGEVDALLSLPFDAHFDGSQGDYSRAYEIQGTIEQAMEEAHHPMQWGTLLSASWALTKDQTPASYARVVEEWQRVRSR
jgi:hypothetical protein